MPNRDGRGDILVADTHAHLDDAAFDDDRDLVIERARQAGVERILAMGTDAASSRRAVELAARHNIVYAAIGLHPSRSEAFAQESDELESLLGSPKVVAVGEIGLDYYRDYAPREAQKETFEVQLRWAANHNLPACIHHRGAEADVLDLLTKVRVIPVLHCFSSDRAVAAQALALGCYLSFAGNVTYPKAAELRAVVADVPTERLLVETDSPYLAPQPRRGRRNEPAFIQMTAAVIAAETRSSTADLAARVRRNADNVFKWGAA